MVNEYRRRRNFIAAAFADMGIECHRPLGAFYAFPSVAKFGLPSKDFALKLLREEKVAVVPGTAFGACGEGFVRCAYATSMENLKEAMIRLKARRFRAGLGAVDQREHRDGRGGLALGLLDARKFAINLRARRFIAQGNSCPPPVRMAWRMWWALIESSGRAGA
jgi:hypothetical protein